MQTLVHGIDPEEVGRMLIHPHLTGTCDSDADPVSACRGEAAAE